ncbi:uncharacterized protein N7506_003438 [Penicillium brevicompactum]|uniref:uncharacterized protein n=1 Tax=Penicillium brevicompactum TaxID=5074 RepID=UPI00254008A5|nr:uncharacterized protein N7506_003438 [Penicillium brevicompactum]KAJ5343614.1 hypothetical protein N7506_003438 [Penicillium brevicompactum]
MGHDQGALPIPTIDQVHEVASLIDLIRAKGGIPESLEYVEAMFHILPQAARVWNDSSTGAEVITPTSQKPGKTRLRIKFTEAMASMPNHNGLQNGDGNGDGNGQYIPS